MTFCSSAWPAQMQSRSVCSESWLAPASTIMTAVFGADDDQVEVGDVALAVGRVEDDLAVDQADAHRADGVVERDLGEDERRRGAVDRQDVGIVLAVGREDEGDDLRLAGVAGGEERAQRPVDQARGDGLLLGGASLALEEAARDPARRVGVLAVVDGQRQEVARHGARLHAGGGEDDGVAEADDARAVGLLGDVAGLERETLRADLDGSLRFH